MVRSGEYAIPCFHLRLDNALVVAQPDSKSRASARPRLRITTKAAVRPLEPSDALIYGPVTSSCAAL